MYEMHGCDMTMHECYVLAGRGGGGESGYGETINVPISTEGSGTPTMRPKTGCAVVASPCRREGGGWGRF